MARSSNFFTWCLGLIWNNASYKVWVCGPQVGHQFVEVFLQEIKHRLAGRSLIYRTYCLS